MSCSTFHTRYTRNLIMSYIQGKSLHGLMRCSVRARAFVLRLWETERLQGEASTNAHVRTRTDSQKKKRWGSGRGGGRRRRRTEVNINLRGPKESLPAARLDAHLFRQSGASSRILANNISSASFSFSPRLFRFLIFGFCCHS